MSLSDRYQLFGDPSDEFVVETVWYLSERYAEWPTWAEVATELAEWKSLDTEEAERRILGAVADGDVRATLDPSVDPPEWCIELDEATSARIGRRYLDMTLRRNQDADHDH